MPQKKVEVKFPFGGVSTDKAEDHQDPQTTRYALNVRGFDYITGRMRGGNRSGTRYYNEPLQTGDVNDGVFAPKGVPQALANVVFDSPRIKYTQLNNNAQTHDDGELVVPATVQEGEEWSSGSSFTTGAYSVVTDVHGNVYTFTEQRNIEKYNADGELLHTIAASGSTASEVPQRLAVDALENIYALTTNNVTGKSTFFRFEPDEDLKYKQRYRVAINGLCRDMAIRGSLMYGVFNSVQVQSSDSELRCYGNIEGDAPIALWSKRAPNPVNGIDVNSRGDIYLTSPSSDLRGTGDQAFLEADISWTPHEVTGGDNTPNNGFNAEERINCWLDAYEIDLLNGAEVTEWNDSKQELTTTTTTLSPFDPVHDTTNRKLRGMSTSLTDIATEENRYSPIYKANGFASNKPGVVFNGDRTSQKADGSTWPTGEALVSQFNSNNENRSHAQEVVGSQLCPIPARDELSPDAGFQASASGTPWVLYLVVKVDADGEPRCLLSSSSSSLGNNGRDGFDFKIVVNQTVSGSSFNNPTVETTPGSIQLLIGENSCNEASASFGLSPSSGTGYGVSGDRWYASDPGEINSDGVAVIALSWSGGKNGSVASANNFVSGLGRFRVNGKDLAFWHTSEAQNGPVGDTDKPSRSFILGAPWENAFSPSSYGVNAIYGGEEKLDDIVTASHIPLKGFKGTVSECFVVLGGSSIGGTYTDLSPNSNDIEWNVFETSTTWTGGTGPTTVETAYDTEKTEAYLAYKWGFQKHLYAEHPFHPDNIGGYSGQPPETNTSLYDVSGISAEEWEDYLQLHYDISDTDKAFGRTEPILAKYSAHNGELKWAFNAPGVGLGVVASDEGDVYTIGEPIDAASDYSKNPTTSEPEPDATARHTIDLGDSFTCETVGNKTPWILNSTEYPVQNYQYPKPILDHDGDVYLPSDPNYAVSVDGDLTSLRAGVFKVRGNLSASEDNRGEGQVEYIVGSQMNLFNPFRSQGDALNGTASRDFDLWEASMHGAGHHAIPGQHGTAIWFPEKIKAPNGLMEMSGGISKGEPCLNLVHTNQNRVDSTSTATTDGSTDFPNYLTGANPKYANLLYNHPDPQRQRGEHIEHFRAKTNDSLGEYYTNADGEEDNWSSGAVSRKLLTDRVDPVTGVENSPAPTGIYEATRAHGEGNGSSPVWMNAKAKHTVAGATQLQDGKLYCFSVFVKQDFHNPGGGLTDKFTIGIHYQTSATPASVYANVDFSTETPTVNQTGSGSWDQASFIRQIGDTGWWRVGVVIRYEATHSGYDSNQDLVATIRPNGTLGNGVLGEHYSWLIWGPVFNQCPTAYPSTDADPAVPFNIVHRYSNASNTYFGSSMHGYDVGDYGSGGGYDPREVEGDARKTTHVSISPYGQDRADSSYDVDLEGKINPGNIDLRKDDEIFVSHYIKKWKKEESLYPENKLVDGGWFISANNSSHTNDQVIANMTFYVYCRKWLAAAPTVDYYTHYPQTLSYSINQKTGEAWASSAVFENWNGESSYTRVAQNERADIIVEDAGDYWRVGMWAKLGVAVDGTRGNGDTHYSTVKFSPWLSGTDDTEFRSLIGGTHLANNGYPQFCVEAETYYWGWEMFVNSGVSPQNEGGLTFPNGGYTDPGEQGTLSVAHPPEQPNYYGYEIKGPEFLYHTTDSAGTNTSSSYLKKNRLVAAEDILGESESARKQHVLLLSDGKLHRVYERGTFNDDGNQGIIEVPWEGQMSTAQSSIQWTQHFGKIYFADSEKYWVYDPLFGDIKELKSKNEGTVPPRGRLITSWRGRLVIARTVEDPYNWYMSAIGDPENWNFFPPLPTAIQATSGNASKAGKAPDIINTLIPYSDDLLLIGGDRSIARMTGDPMAGGQIDIISQSIGIAFGDSHTRDPEGNIYFVSTDACVYAMSPGGQMQKISNNFVENDYLRHLDDSLFRVRLVWNHKDDGLHIFFVPSVRLLVGDAEPLAFKALFWERKNNAWWPDEFDYQRAPYAALSINGDKPNDRELLLAAIDYNDGGGTADTGWRNLVSAWGNPTTTHPMATTDSGVTFNNDVFIDVINEHVRDGNEQFRAIAIEAEMAYPTSTVSPPHAALHVADRSDDLWINGEQVEVDLPYDDSRRTLRLPLRSGYRGNGGEAASYVTKGTNMGIRIRAPYSARFALESMHLIVAPTGRRVH